MNTLIVEREEYTVSTPLQMIHDGAAFMFLENNKILNTAKVQVIFFDAVFKKYCYRGPNE